jgi:hypothetical protein
MPGFMRGMTDQLERITRHRVVSALTETRSVIAGLDPAIHLLEEIPSFS